VKSLLCSCVAREVLDQISHGMKEELMVNSWKRGVKSLLSRHVERVQDPDGLHLSPLGGGGEHIHL
jgi:hypothetical protein